MPVNHIRSDAEERTRVTKTNLVAAKDHGERVKIIADAYGGPDNVTTKEVLSLIHSAGVKCARQTVSTALNELRKANDNVSESESPASAEADPTDDTPEDVSEPPATPEPAKERPSGQGVALFALISGVLMSMAANVMHTMIVVPAETGSDYDLFAVIFAGVWPLVLFLALEVLTKVRWRADRARWVRIAAVTLIAAVAGWVSFHHMSSLFMYWGDDPLAAYAGPLAIDGLVAVAAMAVANNRKA